MELLQRIFAVKRFCEPSSILRPLVFSCGDEADLILVFIILVKIESHGFYLAMKLRLFCLLRILNNHANMVFCSVTNQNQV